GELQRIRHLDDRGRLLLRRGGPESRAGGKTGSRGQEESITSAPKRGGERDLHGTRPPRVFRQHPVIRGAGSNWVSRGDRKVQCVPGLRCGRKSTAYWHAPCSLLSGSQNRSGE